MDLINNNKNKMIVAILHVSTSCQLCVRHTFFNHDPTVCIATRHSEALKENKKIADLVRTPNPDSIVLPSLSRSKPERTKFIRLVWRRDMAEDMEATTSSLSQGLTPQDPEDAPKSPPNSPNSSTRKVSFKSEIPMTISLIVRLCEI